MATGVVLTGGASRRMGHDKALVEIDSVAMAARVAAALAGAGCDPVILQGGDAEALAALGLSVAPDSRPGEGPVAAIADALAAAAPDDVVVSACDLPWLDSATVADLLTVADASPDADVVVAGDEDGTHLVGVWRMRGREPLAGLLAEGVRSYRGALARLATIHVPVPPAAVANVNTPEDLRRRR